MNLPDRFDIGFTLPDGSTKPPGDVTRRRSSALLSVLPFFLNTTLVNCPPGCRRFRPWSPTIADKQHRYAEQVLKALRRKGLRCETDLRNEKIGYKIREQTLARIPFLLIIGDAEENAALRVTPCCANRAGNMGTLCSGKQLTAWRCVARPPEVRLD